MTDPWLAPTDLGVVTGEAVAVDVRPTGYALRAAGAAIDVAAEVLLAIGLLIGIGLLSLVAGLDDGLGSALAVIVLVFSFVIAPTVVETATRGRSLGKLVVGGRIVRVDGGAISARHAFIRALVGTVELVATFGGVAALTGLVTRKAQRLGDLLAGTISQLERVPRVPSTAFSVPAELRDWSMSADVARLPDRLARRIASFLIQSGRMSATSRGRLAADLLAEAAPYVQPMPDAAPPLVLAAVAAIRRERELAALTAERARMERLADVLSGNPNGFPDR